MAEPTFLLQIVHARDGVTVATFPGGGPVERQFIEHCTAHLLPVVQYAFRAETLRTAIAAALTAALMDIKQDTLKGVV